MTETPRSTFRITGKDAHDFLQNLVTNDIESGPLVYAALLTPQGKYLADFFLVRMDKGFILDVAESHATALAQRLNMYRLRADVQIEPADIVVATGTGPAPEGSLPDPRIPDQAWRAYDGRASDDTDWAEFRVMFQIPQTGVELTQDTYILEAGFENLHGVDFKKGCYVGQEVTARMKHKTDLRKGLTRLSIQGEAPIGAEISSNGKRIGHVFTQAKGRALAHVRFDRITQDMVAGDARLSPEAD